VAVKARGHACCARRRAAPTPHLPAPSSHVLSPHPLCTPLQFLRQLLAPERKNTCVAAARRVSPELKQLQQQHPDRLVLTHLDVADEASVTAWAKDLAAKVGGAATVWAPAAALAGPKSNGRDHTVGKWRGESPTAAAAAEAAEAADWREDEVVLERRASHPALWKLGAPAIAAGAAGPQAAPPDLPTPARRRPWNALDHP
jgi:hypothetical protein